MMVHFYFSHLLFFGGVIPNAAVFQAEREPALSESKGISRASPRNEKERAPLPNPQITWQYLRENSIIPLIAQW
jgi:hypothetical protein